MTTVGERRSLTLQGYENGFFIGGSLFDHVTADMKIYKEEIFGSVLCVVRASGHDSALKFLNEHEFGNGTAIFTRDGDTDQPPLTGPDRMLVHGWPGR